MNSFYHFDFVQPYLAEIFSRSVKGAVLIVLILVLRRLLKNRITPAWRHAIWLLVPLLLFWPRFPASVCSIDNWSEPPREYLHREFSRQVMPMFVPHEHFVPENMPLSSSDDSAVTAHAIVETAQIPETRPVAETKEMMNDVQRDLNFEAAVRESQSSLDIFPILFGIWFFMLIFLMARIVWQTVTFRRVVSRSKQITASGVREILDDVKARLNIRRDISLHESPQIAGPTLCGLFRPRVLFPAGFVETLDEMQLAHILMHELAHWKRGDLWTGWLAAVTVAIHWFNPMIWIAARTLNGDREEASDALVLAKLGSMERADYGETLLTLSEQLSHVRTIRFIPGAAGIMESRSLLRRRIEMITSRKHFSLLAKIFCLAFVLVIAAVLLTGAIKRDAGEKLFGVIPIPKKETPNNASVVFEKVKRNTGMYTEENKRITIRGKFVTPNGEPFEKEVRYTGTEIGESYSASFGDSVAADGSFSFKICENAETSIFFEDKSEQWAAPIYNFDTYDMKGDELDITVPVDRPVRVIGHLKDKETGAPLAGVRVAYIPIYPKVHRTRSLWTVTTDSEGTFRKAISTGEYMFVVDSADAMYLSGEWGSPEDKAIFGRTINVTDLSTPTIELTYQLPKLFKGRLLNPDGTPAKNQSVSLENIGDNMQYMGTSTNDEGIFHLYKTPKNVVMTVNSPSPNDSRKQPRLHRWIDNELVDELVDHPQETTVFHLLEPATIRARFINAKTGEPFTEFSVGTLRWNRPGDDSTKTNNSWGFTPEKKDVPGEFLFACATPGVEYHFSGTFPGINHSGDALVATPAESGQYLDMGDVLIDDQPYPEPERLQKLPLHVVDLNGKAVRKFELSSTDLFSGGGTSRGIIQFTELDPTFYPSYASERTLRLMGVRDPANGWVTKPITIAYPDEWKTLTEIRFDTVRGEMIRGVVLDESTGQPIANIPLTLVQKIPRSDETPGFTTREMTLEWKLTTDAEGRFAIRMPPGEFGIGVNDTYQYYGHAVAGNREKELWTRSFRLEEGKPISLEFRIPAPFVGKVFTVAGKPAARARVNYNSHGGKNIIFQTDANGEFRFCETPKPYSYFSFESDYSQTDQEYQRLIRWVEPGETLMGKTVEFRLSDIDAVGRLVDTKTGVPVPYPIGMQISVEAKHPSGSGRYKSVFNYLSESSREEGKFRIRGLTPGVRYTLRFDYPQDENGVVVIPAGKGNTINIGDVMVELKK